MKFKEWLSLNERATVRNVPSSRSTIMNQGVLRGAATTWGHTDNPSWAQKGTYHLLSGIGGGVRKGLENDIGLVVHGSGNIRPMPGVGTSAQDASIKYFSLPLQIPKHKYNKQYQILGIKLNTGDPVTPNRIYKDVLRIVQADMIRHLGDQMDVEVNGKFLLLHAKTDEEGNKQWNWDPNESKQFTRALIYKCIVDEMNKNQKERSEYDINSFELVDEKEQNGVMISWFAFDSSNQGRHI